MINPFVGIVGGGQLAKMLCQAAKVKNVNTIVQTGFESDPAVAESRKFILSNPENIEGTKKLANLCQKITFENEWINIDLLSNLEKDYSDFIPSLRSLSPLVDKISQRKLLSKLKILGPKWIPLSSINKKQINLPSDWNFPVMAKIGQGGYDGKGTKKIKDIKALEDILNIENPKHWILESWVDYDQELAIIASRDLKGKIRTFPLVQTFQSKQICDWVIAPAQVSQEIYLMAYNIVSSLLVELNYVGVMAIEFFYGHEGLLVNEIAPRTHNSGHYSIEACNSSQFDQQISIVADLPVSDPILIKPGAIMVNLIGLSKRFPLPLNERLAKITNIKGASLHWYGKSEERPGRKLGHVTVVLNSSDPLTREAEAKSILENIRSIWPMFS